MGLRRLLSVTLAVATGALVASAVPAQGAHAQSTGQSFFSVSVTGTAGSQFFSPRNASVNLTQTWNRDSYGTYEEIHVGVATKSGGSQYSFDFATPNGSGQRFATRFYRWAQQYPFNAQGRPGISVQGNQPGCGNQTGNFEVRSIHRSGLRITRLWLVWERWCSPNWVEYGELRLGYPKPTYNVSPRVVVWPWSTIYPGDAAPAVPVRVRLTSSKTVTASQPSVSGTDAGDFPIRKQNCTGKLTASGCTVWVGFAPKAPGPRHAKLIVLTSAGRTSVSLDGTGGLGTSSWTVNLSRSNPPQTEHYAMSSASVGNPYEIQTQAFQPQSDGTYLLWNADFGLHNGSKWQAGTTYSYASSQNPFSMSIAQGDAGCEINSGSVTLNDVAYTGPDHDLARMDAKFYAACQSSDPYTISARMLFHARSDITAPGRVTSLKAVRKGGRVALTWTKPAASDLAGIIVRWYSAKRAPSVWWAGNTAHFAVGSSTSFAASATRPVAVSVWAYDKTGNVSAKASTCLP